MPIEIGIHKESVLFGYETWKGWLPGDTWHFEQKGQQLGQVAIYKQHYAKQQSSLKKKTLGFPTTISDPQNVGFPKAELLN